MHIFYILYEDSPVNGGSFRVAQNLIKGFKDLGCPYTVCFVYGSKGIIGKENPESCAYLNAIPRRGYLSLFKFLYLIRLVKSPVVHFIDPVYWMQVLLIFYRKKAVMHVHGAFWNKPKAFRQRILWWISRKSIKRFVAITHTVKDNLFLHRFVDENSIDVVYNSVDMEKIKNPKLNSQCQIKKINIPSNCKVIGSVGRVVSARGFDDLIRLLQFLKPNWCVLIVGGGPYIEELKNLSIDLNLSSRVYFSGQVDDVVPYYEMMDIYGFFARYESFGLALADAMLLKKPIFGLQGAGEYVDPRYPLITSRNSTLLMRPDHLNQWRRESDETLQQLASIIHDYVLNPDGYNAKCDYAYNHVISCFNLRLQAQEMIKVYRSL
jgi:glycosyltransferase involved in cell wall biosynthesis